MDFPLEFYFFSLLVFLLEKLVYFENWWYEVIWSHWRPSSTTTLDKLVKRKEDELWQAVISGKDGQVRRIFEDIANKPEARVAFPNVTGNDIAAFSPSSSPRDTEAGASSYRPDTKLLEAVETDVKEHEVFGRAENREMAVQARLEAIAERLANSSRSLTKKEQEQAQKWWNSDGSFSLLWMAIQQDHKSDVDYLLTEHNQKLHKGNGFYNETVLHLAVWKNDLDLIRDILEKSSSTSPHTYINTRDTRSKTVLHVLVINSPVNRISALRKTVEIVDLLLQYGANINALDNGFRTPLHQLLETLIMQKNLPRNLPIIPLDPLMDAFLQAGAEVNTKDYQGM
ncbi:ankyrin repeat domain-containing protein [Fusarium globosum]|uniref:Ankyrin repeat domain-containing protein n=1 Tax=Fusarium globosum TaxID=78864 RepID=A0A8H5Y552_9HYPO|nr:ankyrin repeat domain-containing protein [Fusarium globosum]